MSLPIGRETGRLGDLLISLIPVFVLASIATFVDVIMFTRFSLRLNRLAPEIVPIA